jgi:hypothetical protein
MDMQQRGSKPQRYEKEVPWQLLKAEVLLKGKLGPMISKRPL